MQPVPPVCKDSHGWRKQFSVREYQPSASKDALQKTSAVCKWSLPRAAIEEQWGNPEKKTISNTKNNKQPAISHPSAVPFRLYLKLKHTSSAHGYASTHQN